MKTPPCWRIVACRPDMNESLKTTSHVGSLPMIDCGLSVCSSPRCGPLSGTIQPRSAVDAPTEPPATSATVRPPPPPPPGGGPNPCGAPKPAGGPPKPGAPPMAAPPMLMQNGHLSQFFS